MNLKLKIAIQKSGKLTEDTTNLLNEAGIKLNSGNGKLISTSSVFPVEILYLRDDDIPQYVEDGVAHIGFVGENVVLERKRKVEIIERLGYARCRLSFAVPKTFDYINIHSFSGKKIATSYPNILREYLIKKKISAEIHEITGSVEIAPNIGLSDAIFDIVSSGSTLISNGLKETETVLQSEAVIISAKLNNNLKKILNELIFRLRAVRLAKNNKYILLNAPDNKIQEICSILPGLKSPTVLPLAQKGWSSLHSVINENDYWEIIDKLKNAGAEGILIIPIEKMIV